MTATVPPLCGRQRPNQELAKMGQMAQQIAEALARNP